MTPQCFQPVVVALKLFVRQHGMDLSVARPTEIDEATSNLTTCKVFFVFLILVPRTWNEMMFSNLTHLTVAQFTY
jgi:hypothetical protein